MRHFKFLTTSCQINLSEKKKKIYPDLVYNWAQASGGSYSFYHKSWWKQVFFRVRVWSQKANWANATLNRIKGIQKRYLDLWGCGSPAGKLSLQKESCVSRDRARVRKEGLAGHSSSAGTGHREEQGPKKLLVTVDFTPRLQDNH